MSSQDDWKKPGMVHWYNLRELPETGMHVLLSTLLGTMIDTRRLPSLRPGHDTCVIDYPNEDGTAFWFDYTADTGDGWHATYAMALLTSSDHVRPEGHDTDLPRGRFLILGGDEVYPRASKDAYAKRLIWPFNEASRHLKHRGHSDYKPGENFTTDLYCIPGNHDWYDGLEAFTRRFCNDRYVGSFRTRQHRSYFVLKLPYNWEIWAADLQLQHDIDLQQYRFFRDHAKSLEKTPGTNVILCLAEPDWVYGEQSREDLHFNVERFERLVERHGGQVRLELAGDIHNYQRYEGTRKPGGEYPSYQQTKIVSGGGGAFLHPTHTFNQQAGKNAFTCEHRYPPENISRGLAWGNWLFAIKNRSLSCLLGGIYTLMFWTTPPQEIEWSFAISHPGSAMLVIMLFVAFYFLADARSKLKKITMGLLHGAVHLAAAVCLWLLVDRLYPGNGVYGSRIVVFLMGSLVGGTIFGLYLLASLNLLGTHNNEAFSSLRIDRYKHFLRFRLTAEGLMLYVIGIKHVRSTDGTQAPKTQLIEQVALKHENRSTTPE